MVLTADKGVCLVVMDMKDYIEKSEELLSKSTYKILPSDPTTRYKNKVIAVLKSIKQKVEYKRMHIGGYIPQGLAHPNIMAFQRSTRQEYH